MTDAVPPLTEGILRAQFDPQTWERARAYVRSGAVHDTRRYGGTLKADVTGSAPQAYRVEATLGTRGITKADCSCPVGGYGECKHVAAVLQLWLAKPAQFVARDAPEIALARLDHAALVAFAVRAVERYPDLERLLDTPLPTGAKRTASVNAQMYRQRVAKAVGDGSGGGYDYYDRGGPDTRELHALVRDGDVFAKAGDYEAAMAVYIGTASEIMDNYEEQYGWDEEGETLEVVGCCFDGLCACLLHETDAEHREEIIEAMYAMSHFGWDLPTEENIEDFLVTHANANERQLLVRWAQEGLSPLASLYERQRVGSSF